MAPSNKIATTFNPLINDIHEAEKLVKKSTKKSLNKAIEMLKNVEYTLRFLPRTANINIPNTTEISHSRHRSEIKTKLCSIGKEYTPELTTYKHSVYIPRIKIFIAHTLGSAFEELANTTDVQREKIDFLENAIHQYSFAKNFAEKMLVNYVFPNPFKLTKEILNQDISETDEAINELQLQLNQLNDTHTSSATKSIGQKRKERENEYLEPEHTKRLKKPSSSSSLTTAYQQTPRYPTRATIENRGASTSTTANTDVSDQHSIDLLLSLALNSPAPSLPVLNTTGIEVSHPCPPQDKTLPAPHHSHSEDNALATSSTSVSASSEDILALIAAERIKTANEKMAYLSTLEQVLPHTSPEAKKQITRLLCTNYFSDPNSNKFCFLSPPSPNKEREEQTHSSALDTARTML